MKALGDYVRTIPDFPKPGIMFRDITTILQDPDGLKMAIDGLIDLVKDLDYDVVVGPEARGFIFGVPVAYAEHKSFVPIRKKGKLPAETFRETYHKEYGEDSIEIHRDAISPDDVVLIHDDLLATGGTVAAAARLVSKFGPKAAYVNFIIEIGELNGRAALPEGVEVTSVIKV